MVMKTPTLRAAILTFALFIGAATSAQAGPPWISVEFPANPFDATTKDAFLTVRTYHHGLMQGKGVTATAEGLVNGRRESVALEVRAASAAGIYAVRWTRPSSGKWVIVIVSSTGGVHEATALVEVSAAGNVAGVTVPSRLIENGRWIVPRPATAMEINALLEGRAVAAGNGISFVSSLTALAR
jgi:hypothetical protein